MIHGDCVSVGCYAMTDSGIDEIFQFVTGALVFGQPSVQVSIYPFRMTNANMERHKYSYADFWKQLKPAMTISSRPQTAGRISDRRPLCGEQAAQPRGCPAAAGLKLHAPRQNNAHSPGMILCRFIGRQRLRGDNRDHIVGCGLALKVDLHIPSSSFATPNGARRVIQCRLVEQNAIT